MKISTAKAYDDSIRDPRIIIRLLSKVKKEENGCWRWLGCRDRKGYGQIKIKGRSHWAHRVSFAIFNNGIPDGLTVHHTCHETGCINPNHLQTMTIAENAKERWSRNIA